MIEAMPMPPVEAAILILVTRWGFPGKHFLHYITTFSSGKHFYENGKQSNETYFCISGL